MIVWADGKAPAPHGGIHARPHHVNVDELTDLAGPMREVVYIFEREGTRGGALWWLVLECGHAVARKRHEAKGYTAMVHGMFRPIEEKFAPKRCQCLYCGSGNEKSDPAILIKAFGGAVP